MLAEAAKKALCYSDVCRAMGLKNPAGGSYELIRNRITEYGIDVSHFLGKARYAGKRNPNYQNRKTPDEVLVDGYTQRASHKQLKIALLAIGVSYKCQCCGLTEWLGKKITLDIDHIDGNWTNCKRENLRFICPNCHRQTDTFAGGNLKKKFEPTPPIVFHCTCGNVMSRGASQCHTCYSFRIRTVERPSIKELIEHVEQYGWSATGRKYNVSDNTIRKWIKSST